MDGLETGFIDYDRRHRGSKIETNKGAAIELLEKIKAWLVTLNEEILGAEMRCSIEVSVSEKLKADVRTTLERELIFAASHAVHHYALISIAAKMQDIKIGEDFGLAPATATFLRESAVRCAR